MMTSLSNSQFILPDVRETLFNILDKLTTKKGQKMYFIRLAGKRFNSKKFSSYEDARKYVRKLITKRFGRYQDSIGAVGFSIDSK
jgi:hypothetical protein